MKKFTFSFKEVNYGSITIEAEHPPDLSDVEVAIMNGGAFFKDTQYEDITLNEEIKPQRKAPSWER